METNSHTLATALLIMDIQPATMQMMGENAASLTTTLNQAISAVQTQADQLLKSAKFPAPP